MKNNFLKITAILLTLIIISTTTTTALSKKTIFDSQRNSILKNILDKIFSIIKNLGIDYPSIGFLSLDEDSIIIDKAKELYNNDSFMNQISIIKKDISTEINKLNYSDEIKNILKLDETFNNNYIFNRISSLKVGCVKDQLLDYIGFYQPNDNKTFNNLILSELEQTLIYLSHNNFTSVDGIYPAIDYICHKIAEIVLLICAIMTPLFGVCGLVLSTVIMMVLFSPIVLPMTVYMSICECLKNDTELKNYLSELFYYFGLVGLVAIGLPYSLEYLWKNGLSDFIYALEYIFNQILLNSYSNKTFNSYSEVKPDFSLMNNNSVMKIGKYVKIVATVFDNDTASFNSNTIDRDYIRIGFTSDKNFVENNGYQKICWGNWYKNDNIVYFETNFIENTLGSHTYYVIAQDNWGIYSDWQEITITAKLTKNRYW